MDEARASLGISLEAASQTRLAADPGIGDGYGTLLETVLAVSSLAVHRHQHEDVSDRQGLGRPASLVNAKEPLYADRRTSR
jgi:hypothetical protein